MFCGNSLTLGFFFNSLVNISFVSGYFCGMREIINRVIRIIYKLYLVSAKHSIRYVFDLNDFENTDRPKSPFKC